MGVNAAQPTFYLDDIVLATNSTPLPAVTMTAPTGGSSYSAPASISLAASVTPNGHSIAKVQFYSGTNLLNEAGISPFSFTWTNVGIGSYSLFARHLRLRRQRGFVGGECDGDREHGCVHHGG